MVRFLTHLDVMGRLLMNVGIDAFDLVGLATHPLLRHGLGHPGVNWPITKAGDTLALKLEVLQEVFLPGFPHF